MYEWPLAGMFLVVAGHRGLASLIAVALVVLAGLTSSPCYVASGHRRLTAISGLGFSAFLVGTGVAAMMFLTVIYPPRVLP